MAEKQMSLAEKLSRIQNELKAPKNLYNKFGNYYYRNAESILEGAKPVCMKYRTTLTLTDEIVLIANRVYVKATATITDWDTGHSIITEAYAREQDAKKGMDESQVTGSVSSYARKYALNGMFNVDDTKDADTNEQHEEIENRQAKEQKKEPEKKAKPAQKKKQGVPNKSPLTLKTMQRVLKAQSMLNDLGVDFRSGKDYSRIVEMSGIEETSVDKLSEEEALSLLNNAYLKIYSEVNK